MSHLSWRRGDVVSSHLKHGNCSQRMGCGRFGGGSRSGYAVISSNKNTIHSTGLVNRGSGVGGGGVCWSTRQQQQQQGSCSSSASFLGRRRVVLGSSSMSRCSNPNSLESSSVTTRTVHHENESDCGSVDVEHMESTAGLGYSESSNGSASHEENNTTTSNTTADQQAPNPNNTHHRHPLDAIALEYKKAFVLSSKWDKEIALLAFPALLTTLLDPIMGMIDAAIVGRLGTAQLAAVGCSTVLYNFSNFIFNFLLYTTTPRIAAAASQKDSKEQVSKIAAQGLWVAITIGCISSTVLFLGCPTFFRMLGTTPDVMEHAVGFLRIRALASPAIMMSYVMSGVFRGFKDTRATLVSSTWSNIAHIVLDVACIFGLHMGALGAAVATTASLWLNWAILAYNISIKHGYLNISDMARYPTFAEVAPMLRHGVLLSTRSLLAMSTLMFATKLAASLGAAALAAHEIIRQIWVVSNQAFTSLDIATQSLVAYYVGRGDKDSAREVFNRTSALTLVAGIMVMSVLLYCTGSLPAIFTSDPAVIAIVASCIPLIAVYMPMDGLASVLDGVLLGSQQVGALSKVMACTSVVCATALVLQSNLPQITVSIVTIWAAIKILTLGRLIGNARRVFSRTHSPLYGDGMHCQTPAAAAVTT